MKVTEHEVTGEAGRFRARLSLQDGDCLLEAPFDSDRPYPFTADHDVGPITWIVAVTGHGEHRFVDFCNPT